MGFKLRSIKRYFRTKLQFLIAPAVEIIVAQMAYEQMRSQRRNVELANNANLTNQGKIINRQNNSQKIKIGEYTVVRGELMIMGYGGFIKIGDYSYVGEGTRIWSGASVIIGHNVLISHNVNIIDTNSHQIDHLERAHAFKELINAGFAKENFNIICKPIIIEDYAWINFNVSILKGVKIGKGAIIGPNSVVINDVEPFTVYAGNPAKIIKKLKNDE